MENNGNIENPSQENLAPKGPSLRFIKLMLFLIAAGVLWIALQSSSRVLVVEIRSISSGISDEAQVRNALFNGGCIRLENSSECYAELLGSGYYDYGARNSDRYFYITGAALNYIASKGWTLVQAPSSGETGYYYFVRSKPRIATIFANLD